MSSISAYASPLQRLQSELQSSVQAGTVKSSDQDVLSNALTNIDSALTSSAQTDTPSLPTDLKSKIDGLIDSQVSNGTLTSDQGTELKSVFASSFSKGGPDSPDSRGHRGPGGGHGPASVGGPPPATSNDNASDESDDTTVTGAADVLRDFLKSLKEAQSSQGTSTYGSSSSPQSSKAAGFAPLLLDYKT